MPGVLKYKDPVTNQWTPTGSPLPEVTEMDLLWENASPTSAFAAQTVNVNSIGYSLVKIIWSYDINHPDRCSSQDAPLGKTMEMTIWSDAATPTGYYRFADINQDGSITFTNASIRNNVNASNANIIPYRIYGIK